MTPDLPTLTRLGTLEGEAGNRAQPDTCCEATLALMGVPTVNQSPKKHPRVRREHNEISRSDWRLSPPCFLKDKGKSLGDPVDEVATPKGTKQSNRRNE